MNALQSPVLAFCERISRISVWIGGLMIVMTAGLITVEILLRKVAGMSTGGADELSGYGLAIGSSWSMGFALLRRAHVRVDALYGRFSGAPRAWLDCLAILSMTGFALVLTWFCAGVLRESITLSARSTTTLSIALWIPQGLWITGFIIFSGLGLILSIVPFLPPRRQPAPAKVFLDHCNGCGRCVDDCPYEALRLTRRTDGAVYQSEAIVDVSKCVSCGICVGSCPSSTPFRRSQDLVTGIDLPDYPLARMRADLVAACAAMTSGPRVLAITCKYGGGASLRAGADLAVLELPCVAMAPPSLIDFALSRRHADGVAVIGCSERFCHNRLGVEWTRQRFAQERDPYLRTRVPRERLATIWTSSTETSTAKREVDALRARLSALPPPSSAPPPVASEPVRERTLS